MKKLIAAAMAAGVVLNSFTVSAATPTFTVSQADAKPGDEVSITIDASDNPGIISFRIAVDYDNSDLSVVRSRGKVFKDVSFGSESSVPYSFLWADAMKGNYTTNGTIAEMVFKVSEQASEGQHPITISYLEDDVLNSKFEQVHFEIVNGGINVIGGEKITSGPDDSSKKSDSSKAADSSPKPVGPPSRTDLNSSAADRSSSSTDDHERSTDSADDITQSSSSDHSEAASNESDPSSDEASHVESAAEAGAASSAAETSESKEKSSVKSESDTANSNSSSVKPDSFSGENSLSSAENPSSESVSPSDEEKSSALPVIIGVFSVAIIGTAAVVIIRKKRI